MAIPYTLSSVVACAFEFISSPLLSLSTISTSVSFFASTRIFISLKLSGLLLIASPFSCWKEYNPVLFATLLSIIYANTSCSTILAYVFVFTRLSFPAISTAINSSE